MVMQGGELGGATVRLSTDNSGIDRGMAAAEQTVSSRMQAMAGTARAGGLAMSAAITAPLVGIATLSVRSFASFDAAMVQSLAIMGDVSDAMRGEMAAAAREVGRTTLVSATEAAEAYFFLASAGLDAAQSVAAMPQVAAFAQAGMFDMARATDLATDAQSALGLTSGDAAQNLENLTRVTDVLVGANTLANASVEQFAESLTNRAAAAARLLGKDVEETVAVLAAMADQGVKGAEAGTRLDIVWRDLSTRALENAEAFERFGIAVFDSSGNMRNTADILADLEQALDGMSDAQARATVQMLGFSDRSVAALLTLLGTSDAIREYERAVRDMGGITQEVADRQLESLSAQFELLRGRAQDIAIALGAALVPALMLAMDGIDRLLPLVERVVEAFVALPAGVQLAVVVLAAIAAAAGPVLFILGSMLPAVGALAAVFPALTVAMAGLFGPVGIAVVGAAVLGALVLAMLDAEQRAALLDGTLALLRATVMPVIDAIKGLIEETLRLVDNLRELGEMADAARDRLLDMLGPLGDIAAGMEQVNEQAGRFASGALGSAFDAFMGALNPVPGALDTVATGLGLVNAGIERLAGTSGRGAMSIRDYANAATDAAWELDFLEGEARRAAVAMDDTAATSNRLARELTLIPPTAMAAAQALQIMGRALLLASQGNIRGLVELRRGMGAALDEAARYTAAMGVMGDAHEALTDIILRRAGLDDLAGGFASAGAGARGAGAAVGDLADAVRDLGVAQAELTARQLAMHAATVLWEQGVRSVEGALRAIHPAALEVIRDVQDKEEAIRELADALLGIERQQQDLARGMGTGDLLAGLLTRDISLRLADLGRFDSGTLTSAGGDINIDAINIGMGTPRDEIDQALTPLVESRGRPSLAGA